MPARHRQRLLAHDGIGVVHLERGLAVARNSSELHEHDGPRSRRQRRGFATREQRTQMNERHQTAPQRRQSADRGKLARNGEDFGRIAHFQHTRDRQTVGLSLGPHEQVALHRPFRASSAVTRSAIWPSGNTASTPPACTAAAGMPEMTAVSRSWAKPLPPASLIARKPSAPSRPIPVRTTPTLRAPYASAMERNSGSAAGPTPQIGADLSNAITGPSGDERTRQR